MSLGTQLHRASLQESYDSIVIGSGVGGLSAAVCLAKAGQKVLVLERHYTAGGFSHTYQRKGYEWDVGLHYVGDVHRPTSSLRRMFDYVSDSKLKWQEMDPVYDKIILGKEIFDYQKGETGFREQMHRYFPNEKSAIEAYISLIKKVNRAASPFFYEKALPHWVPTPIRKYLKKEFLDISQKSTREVLEGLTQNQKLIAVLSGQWGDYGLPPEESSFAMHALVAKHYLSGASYPIRGSSSLARTMLDALRACGGDVITNAEVTSILLEKDMAVGVQLRNGRKISARHIISAVGVLNTFQRLLPEGTLEKFGIKQGTHQLQPSFSHLCLCLGIKGSQKELRLGTSNLWIYKNERHEENIKAYMDKPNLDFPVVYISFPSAKDPEWAQNFPDKSTVEIVVPAPYHWFEKWSETKWMKRGQEYNEFKKAITERLIEILLEYKPELKERIHIAELSTPLSTAHFSHYPKGEIYGVDHTSQRFLQDWIRTDSPIKNLYLTGQDIVTCGIAGALSSGFLTASRILGPIQSLPFLKHMLGSFQPKIFRKKRFA